MSVRSFLFFLLGLTALTQACECNKGKDIPDVSHIPVEVNVRRFERDLFSLDTTRFAESLGQLEAKYPEFSEVFFQYVLGSKDTTVAQEGHEAYVRGFITQPDVRQLYDTCQLVFPGMEKLQKDFQQAFRFFKHYFPLAPLPGEVVTYISGFSIGGFLYGNNSIAVGLDFYLGDHFPYLQIDPSNPNFSKYMTRTFNRDHLVMKSMKLLVQDMLGKPAGNKMLDHMIHYGKELYLLDRLLPYTPDSVKLEYSQEQVNWCEDNELGIWSVFIQDNLLYSTDWGKFRKLVEYSPTSPGMPKESPGRTANWIGWKIVEAYMKRFPETTPDELIMNLDAQAILDGSRYKPKR